MKKKLWIIIALVAALTLCGLLTACNQTEESQPAAAVSDTASDAEAIQENLEYAVEYLKTFYKSATVETPGDFKRICDLRVGLEAYTVSWSVDAEEAYVKVVAADNGNVLIDVNENSDKEVAYVLTATISDAAGNSIDTTWNHILPGFDIAEMQDLVDRAYALDKGDSLPETVTLRGVITSVDTPYDSTYKNISVTIQIEGREDKPILCYRLKGEGADTLAIGDTITVTGIIKNYNGTIEFDAGCVLEAIVKGENEAAKAPEDPAEIMKQAYALKSGESLPYTCTLTGKVTSLDEPYSSQYNNITVTMLVQDGDGYSLKCYRLKGKDADKLNVNAVITVTGRITNYKGTIEFESGCTLDAILENGDPVVIPATSEEIMKQAWALAPYESLPYNCTISGRIITIDTPYSEEYDNITVTIVVDRQVDFSYGYTVQCYRMTGEDLETLNVNDHITVTGQILNYDGIIEFNKPKLNSIVQMSPPARLTNAHDIVEAAYNLTSNMTLPYEYTLTGKVTNVKYEWSEKYGNVSLTIAVQHCDECISKPIYCHQMTGTKAELQDVEYGDTITVKGYITNYFNRDYNYNTIEYNRPTMLKLVKNTAVAPSDPKQIVDEAFALAAGDTLDYKATLTGKITSIKTPYSSTYDNITVIMEVEGSDGMKKLECYRMKGDGVDDLYIGDTITVSGYIKNYNGTIEYDAGCILEDVIPGPRIEVPSDPKEIVDAAFALAQGETLPYEATLTGVINKIDTPYSSTYKNITVTMEVEGTNTTRDLMCYRLKGDGADTLEVGDTITVTGYIKNHYGTVEFDSGSTLVNVVKGEGGTSDDTTEDGTQLTQVEIVNAAYALASGESLDGNYTLTGEITKIDTAYNTQYKNISIIIAVSGAEDKPILCYRLKGNGADSLAVGDTVTVTGTLTNYNGTIEFTSGCTLDAVEKGETVKPTDPKEIVDAAFALAEGESLPYSATLTGDVVSIDDAYSETYGNITVSIEVEGSDGMKTLKCYRLKGTGADTLAVGDTITVTGIIKNYCGTVEFDSGCSFVFA